MSPKFGPWDEHGLFLRNANDPNDYVNSTKILQIGWGSNKLKYQELIWFMDTSKINLS